MAFARVVRQEVDEVISGNPALHQSLGDIFKGHSDHENESGGLKRRAFTDDIYGITSRFDRTLLHVVQILSISGFLSSIRIVADIVSGREVGIERFFNAASMNFMSTCCIIVRLFNEGQRLGARELLVPEFEAANIAPWNIVPENIEDAQVIEQAIEQEQVDIPGLERIDDHDEDERDEENEHED
jgi:hypothetical protein